MEHSLKISTTKTGKEGFLSLKGDLTMEYACDIQKILLEAIDAVDSLHIGIDTARSIDVSFLQLLCAAHRECFLLEKQIRIDGDIGASMESLLERAGYSRRHGCLADVKKSCLLENASSIHSCEQ